jgi:23S rRNA (uracil1939-C5)-methyltransferase
LQKTKIKRGEELELRITSMAFGGNGIARIATESGELVVFVPNTIPGQLVRCKTDKVRKKHIETKLIEVLEPSPDEVEIPYQRISGAPYAALPVEMQEKYKTETSIGLMKRIGHVVDATERFDVLVSSPAHWHYRNKMEYAFAAIRYDLESGEELDDFALGFKHRGTWWMVENLDKDSGLFDAQVESQLHLIRKFCESSGLPAWHAPRRQGFFRFLTVRKSYAQDQLLFNLVTTDAGLESFDMKGFIALLKSIFAERLAGLMHTINNDTGERVQPLQGASRCVYGKDHITEVLHGIPFEISMESFFQTNPKSAEKLYSKALAYLREGASASATVFDLFCGTGTIAQLIARQYPEAKVVGVDIEAKAIADAKKAAEGIENIRFFAADVGKFLLEHPEYVGAIDAIVLDPPRAGIAPKALKRTIELGAPCIVYISCNPATLARDTETLQSSGYMLEKFALVDQFPHTSHIEAVSLFKLQH